MTRTAPFRLLLSAALILTAAAANAADLQVTLHDVRSQSGTINVALVDSAEGWDGKANPVQARNLAPTGSEVHLSFKDLPAGTYAVLVTHDENGNGKLDTNMLGMPLEGYGFSNNPRVMRKPTFDEARVALPTDGTAIDISLR